jgi:hypothetical protein
MDPLTAALAGLDASSQHQIQTDYSQLTSVQQALEKQQQQQQQAADAVPCSDRSVSAAAIAGNQLAGNHSRNPSSLSIDPLSAAIQDDEDGVTADEQSDTLSPLSSPGAAAAEAAANLAGSSDNGSSNSSSGSEGGTRPIPVPMPALPDPDLDPEELGQLLQKVGALACKLLVVSGLMCLSNCCYGQAMFVCCLIWWEDMLQHSHCWCCICDTTKLLRCCCCCCPSRRAPLSVTRASACRSS